MTIQGNDPREPGGTDYPDHVSASGRQVCERCRRPLTHCLCATIPSLDSRTRVLVLQHPDEARHALNTARLAVLGLRNAALHVGRQFDAALWRQADYRPCLLFPGDDAQVLRPVVAGGISAVDGGCGARGGPGDDGGCGAGGRPEDDGGCGTGSCPEADVGTGANVEAVSTSARPVLLVVPDGTWRHARRLLATHPALADLPRVTLPPGTVTRYRVRHAAQAGALSTIEAIAAALEALEAPRSFAALLAPFDALVAGQIAAMGQDRYERDHVQRAGSREAKRSRCLSAHRQAMSSSHGQAPKKTNPREP